MGYYSADKCVACGQSMELYGSHHCPPDYERRRENRDKQEQEEYARRPTEAARLNYGFYLLTLGGW